MPAELPSVRQHPLQLFLLHQLVRARRRPVQPPLKRLHAHGVTRRRWPDLDLQHRARTDGVGPRVIPKRG